MNVTTSYKIGDKEAIIVLFECIKELKTRVEHLEDRYDSLCREVFDPLLDDDE